MSKTLRVPVIGLLLLCFAASAHPAQDLDTEIAAQEQARRELEKKIQQYNETAGKKSQQARGLQTRLSDLQKNSQMAQQQIKLLELQSDRLQRSISALEWEMAEISRQVETLISEVGSRVVSIYKYGSREELNLLLSVEDAHEAVASAYLLERLARHDRLVVEGLLNRAAELGRGKRNVEISKAQLMTRTEELNNEREKYSAVIGQTSAMLSGVQRERQRAEVSAKEMEQAQQEIERTIAGLMLKKRERLQDARPPAETGANANVNVNENVAEERVYPVLERGTQLEWPVRGTISAHFGPREHPVFKTKSFNSGIDISASSGTPVRAAGPGEVLYEGWLRGFGQVVIIDHGRNISTVYANLGSTRVKEKDAVMPGTVIGTVGSAGTAEGYSLRFEVRVGDAAKNPLDYLKKT
ncbi:MAG: peptidoglycan DD-metalloendopeptidase family protein [Synergistaceae bacterium]|nr:peptidoglycan DD-metalloendopeptidase family protein [Synergistaceae bacterium]